MRSELFECNGFNIIPLNKQAEDFLLGLSDRDWAKFESAVVFFTRLLRSSAPAVHRVEKVSGSSTKLYELKITAPHSKGPQLRLLCAVRGRQILCVRGVDKRQPHLRRQDVEAADRAVADHLRSKNERKRKKKRKRKGRS
jgi:hypothetical protein